LEQHSRFAVELDKGFLTNTRNACLDPAASR